MYGFPIPIDNTLKLVSDIADAAEMSVQRHIRKYYHMSNEEFITHMLHGQMKFRLRKASKDQAIEEKFLKDLMAISIEGAELDWSTWDYSARIQASGLIADVILHNKREEGRTGGDFGLVFNRPLLELSDRTLMIVKGKRQGLLCQAKLKGEDGKWGNFTERQTEILPERFPYAALPLYSYGDESRTILNPIQWYSCKGKTFSEVQQKLETDPFDETISTGSTVSDLGKGNIGTPDDSIIDSVIALSSRPFFEIRIYWKDDKDSEIPVFVEIPVEEEQKQLIKVFNHY